MSLAPFPSMPIDTARLFQYTDACVKARVDYGPHPGYKASPVGQWPVRFRHIDCSGFVRAAILYATHGKTLMPDGSWNQNDWLEKQGFKYWEGTHYNTLCALHDGHVRVCLHRAGEGGEKWGHIWIVVNGASMESHGGRGPGTRPYDTPTLKRIVNDIYVVA